MIFSADAPLDADWRTLHALHVSLNSPVVALAPLPVGPAAALVALHGGAAPGATLVVRSLRTGRLACFVSEAARGSGRGAAEGVEAALAFAESMGFLFDEERLAGAPDRREAVRPWWELFGDGAGALAAGEAGEAVLSEASDPGALELLLEDPADEALAAETPLVAPELLLSKFRRGHSAALPEMVGAVSIGAMRPEPHARLRLTSRF